MTDFWNDKDGLLENEQDPIAAAKNVKEFGRC
jgi:hypothetical protein